MDICSKRPGICAACAAKFCGPAPGTVTPSKKGTDQSRPLVTRHEPSATWPSETTCSPGTKFLSDMLMPLSV
eukprot:158579-Prymnesium_polylepis.1